MAAKLSKGTELCWTHWCNTTLKREKPTLSISIPTFI
jgi:hypothetical protein